MKKYTTRKDRMRSLFDRFSAPGFFLLLFTKVLQVFKKIGIRAREDGWQQVVRTFFRTEQSKFSLAAFRLDLWSNARAFTEKNAMRAKVHFIRRFATFLRAHPEIDWQLDWKRFSVRRVAKEHRDFVFVVFDEHGNIRAMEPYFYDAGGVVCENICDAQDEVVRTSIVVYNSTRIVPDKLRPILLKKRILERMRNLVPVAPGAHASIVQFIDRLLSASMIHLEVLPEGDEAEVERFALVDFIRTKHPGWGSLTIVGRFSSTFREVDVWVHTQHVAADGMPVQELLNCLKQEWGTAGPCVIPQVVLEKTAHVQRSSTYTGKLAVYQTVACVRTNRFLDLRQRLIKDCGPRLAGSLPVVGLMVWLLGHHPLFRERKFLITVDIAGSASGVRRPGFVFVRPSTYFNAADPFEGLIAYVNDVSDRIESTRQRTGANYELLQLYALFHPFVYRVLYTLFPHALKNVVGTVGMTMIKDSDLFMAPSSEIHTDGFLAFSNLLLPTYDGGTAGVVTIKARREQIDRYIAAIREVMNECEMYLI